MKRLALRLALLLGLLAVIGLAVAASGIVPIKASSGHWPPTRWFLEFSKRRSVATHTLGAEQPDLDAPWMVMKGAGHYHAGCLPCHGGPDDSTFLAVARAMTPRPPDLRARVDDWEADELFYIVKHGLKFTGMPAFPAPERDDEVAAVVAFLLALPDLDAAAYAGLVHGEARPAPDTGEDAGPASLAACARCHGHDGNGRETAAFPRLAGQSATYLENALTAYARGERSSGMMRPFAEALDADEIAALARHYAALAPAAPATDPTAEYDAAIARGRELAENGDPARRVPACVACHGPGPEARNPAYPHLAGQHADYLALQLRLFADGRRGGSSFAHLMTPVAARLTPEQIRDVTLYYGSLGP